MFKKLTAAPEETDWLYSPDWEYRDYGTVKRHLQMLLPHKPHWESGESYPLILAIPGSAWRRQELYNDIPKYAALARRGFVVAVMEYRESEIARFPAQAEDVVNALDFLRGKAELIHYDPDRVFLMGNSSGGHVALMAALLSAHGLIGPLPGIRGVISVSGSLDLPTCAKNPLPPGMNRRPAADLLGVDSVEDNESLAERASCGMYITEDAPIPPVLLFHSENDPVVSAENSALVYRRLTAAGKRADYYELEGTSHGGLAFFSEPILDILSDFCQRA